MSIRRDPIYISSDVWRWLRLLAKAELVPQNADRPVEGLRIATPDEIADQILRQAIREQHPTLTEGLKEIEKLEKKIIDNLKNENSTLPGTGSTPTKP